MPKFWCAFRCLRVTAASALLSVSGFFLGSGCSVKNEKPRSTAVEDAAPPATGDLFQPTEHWVSLPVGGGALARVPRASGVESSVNLALLATRMADDTREPKAATVALPPAETAATPLSWVEAQRLGAIEASRAKRSVSPKPGALASTDNRRAPAAAESGTVRLSVQHQPAAAPREDERTSPRAQENGR